MHGDWRRLLFIFIVSFLSASNSISEENKYSSPILLEETEEITFHPAGPTIRKEWRERGNLSLSRVEVTRIRSGQVIFGNVTLLYHPTSGWSLVNKSKNTILKITSRDISKKNPLLFDVEGQKWSLTVTREEVPIARAGISTEAEYALDIECVKLDK